RSSPRDAHQRRGSEWSGDRRSAEWRRVAASTSPARLCGWAQLRREGEASVGFCRGCGISRVEGRRQEAYDIIEITFMIDASEPGLIRGLASASVTGTMTRRASSVTLKRRRRGACKRSRIVILASSEADQ